MLKEEKEEVSSTRTNEHERAEQRATTDLLIVLVPPTILENCILEDGIGVRDLGFPFSLEEIKKGGMEGRSAPFVLGLSSRKSAFKAEGRRRRARIRRRVTY